MLKERDSSQDKILKIISNSDEPLETREIETRLKETRIKVLYRLFKLRGEGKIQAKQVGSGKGCWIWWKKDAF